VDILGLIDEDSKRSINPFVQRMTIHTGDMMMMMMMMMRRSLTTHTHMLSKNQPINEYALVLSLMH